MLRTYSKLILLPTFEERYEYLKLNGVVGRETFGFDRYLNQVLYVSKEWRRFRREIIIRDQGCDLGIEDREIFVRPTVHHLNPVTLEMIDRRDPSIFDPENVITTSHMTHEAIHYGDISLLPTLPQERRKGDTCPWMTVS